MRKQFLEDRLAKTKVSDSVIAGVISVEPPSAKETRNLGLLYLERDSARAVIYAIPQDRLLVTP